MEKKEPNRLLEKIISRIKSEGPMEFSEFMEAALYDSEYGYYLSAKKRIGFGGGDFFTSPAMSPAFGMTLARLAPLVDEALGRPPVFTIVELGAGESVTASQIVDSIESEYPDLFSRLNYICIDVKEKKENERIVYRDIGEIKDITGIILSNEFFDALPVRRIAMRNGVLRGISVGESGGKLVEIETDIAPESVRYLDDFGIVLAEGQKAEICLRAVDWIENIADRLRCGLVATIDYGYSAGELYAAFRKNGTLIAYEGHKTSHDVFENVGGRDITAHVNFSALAHYGEKRGLKVASFTDQLRFFLELGIHEVFAQLEKRAENFASFQVEAQAAKALIQPAGLGETFKVLLQSKGLDEREHIKFENRFRSKYKLR